jgi:hypothetical protein
VNATTDKAPRAAYMSWATLESLFERLDKGGVPPKIDRSILGGAEGYKTLVLTGLKWLGLIENDGRVTERLETIINEPDRRQKLVAELFHEKYPKQIALGESNASQRDLEMSFEPLTGDTARKAVSFYLKGAKFAELPLSSYFITPRTRKPSANGKAKPRKPAKPKGGGDGGGTQTETGIQVDGVHPALAGLLNDLPRLGRGWTEDQRAQFKTVWDAMLQYAIPIVESPEDDADDDDLDDEADD